MAGRGTGRDILTLSHVEKRFGEKQVLRDVDFSVPEHTVFGFVGKNGAGKTTAMKLVLGLLSCSSGEIQVNGMPVRYGNTPTNRFVGYLPDVPEFYSYMSPAEYLQFCGEIVLQGSVEEVKKSRKAAKTELETERPEDARLLLSQFPFLKMAGQGSLLLEDTGRLWEILHFIAEKKLPVLRVERQEAALEDLFLEIIGK